MFLWYPQKGRGNEWRQESNPTVPAEYGGGVIGFEVCHLCQLFSKERHHIQKIARLTIVAKGKNFLRRI